MKIYNQDKTQVLENVDLKRGYLIDDKIIIKTIPATEEVKEQFHYEYKTYESGGKERIKIVDVPYVSAKPESYEYEDIQIYIPFTEEELKQNRIAEIEERMKALDQDFRQADLGAVFEDLEERKAEFISLHNEWRVLNGKEPREYIKKEV